MSSPNVTIVLPVKVLRTAKSRLAPVLDDGERARFALEMFSHVLTVCSRAKPFRLVVLSPDDAVGELAAGAGATWVRDPAPGLNRSLGSVFEACWRKDETPLYLPSDLPLLETSDVHSIARAASDAPIVVCSSRDRRGTNALMVSPKTPMAPELGAGSFERHLSRAAALGYEVAVSELSRIGFDIDTPCDWAELGTRRADQAAKS